MYSVVLIYHSAFEDASVEAIDWDDMNCKLLMTTVTTKEEIVKILKIKPDMIFICTKDKDTEIFDITREFSKALPNTVIGIISSILEFDFVKMAMNAGTAQYISLPVNEEDFKASITAMKQKVTELKHHRHSKKGKGEAKDGDEEEINSFAVRNALIYIEANYKKKIRLEDVAEDIFLSKWYLSKLLNQYLGKSFSSIVNGYRIEEAKKLLKEPSYQISTVAEMTGFKDASHFSHVFKRITGMSAHEYRNSVIVPNDEAK